MITNMAGFNIVAQSLYETPTLKNFTLLAGLMKLQQLQSTLDPPSRACMHLLRGRKNVTTFSLGLGKSNFKKINT